VIRRVSLLIGGTLGLWLLTVAYILAADAGTNEVLVATAAMGLCLVPALVTLLVIEGVAGRHLELLGITFLAGTLLQLVVIGAAAVLLDRQVEFFRGGRWMIWVVVFGLVTLGLETAAVVVGRGQTPPAA